MHLKTPDYPLPFNPDFHRELGGLFIAGFEGKKAKGPVLDAVRAGLGGVILFPENLGKPGEIRKLTSALRNASPGGDLIVSIDQEGGRVARLTAPFTEFPPMSAIGAKKDPELARRVGKAIAHELLAVGINLDFAPVMDVDEPLHDAAIGDRSFSTDPETVAAMGAAFIEGMQGEGVAACAKHFPGHGATDRDSHVELPEIHLSKTEMKRHVDPFRAAINANAATVMTAHIRCHAFDRYHPATLSAEMLTRLLRMEMGFQGVVVTDDMGMKGVSELMPAEDAAALALRAGADILLIAHDLALAGKLRASIHEAVRHMLLMPDDILDKIERASSLRKKFKPPADLPPLDVIGCKAHLDLAKEAAA